MTFDEFHNGLRILTLIDSDELVRGGLGSWLPRELGGMSHREAWSEFYRDPFRFFLSADDETAEKLWAIIEGRQPGNRPHIHVAGTTVGMHIDKCAKCGRDLRDPIHARSQSNPAASRTQRTAPDLIDTEERHDRPTPNVRG